jgi:tetratricopeptide (TPR) repeat protein
MKALRFIIVLSVAGGCAHNGARTKPPRSAIRYVKLQLPKGVDSRSYRRMRQLYDSLPLAHPQRAKFREKLSKYLVENAHQQLRRKRGGRHAMRSFLSAASLYDPTEVYAGKIRDAGLTRLATTIVKRFSPPGDTRRVLPALIVRITLEPKNKALPKELWRIIRWVEKGATAIYGPSARGHKTIPVMERTARVWPSIFALETLRKLYLEQRALLHQVGPLRGLIRRHGRFHFPVLRRTGYNLARVYLWVDRPYKALKRLRELPTSDENSSLRRLLERATSPSANVDDALQLAEEFEEHHPRVALRVCQRAADRFYGAARAHSCVGRLAARTGNVLLATSAYRTAQKLQPGDPRHAIALVRQYQKQVELLVYSEQLDQAQVQIERLREFQAAVEKRFGKPIEPSLAGAYYSLGFGMFNAGRITLATKLFSTSLSFEKTPRALLKLALIALKRWDGKAAQKYLRQAEGLSMRSTSQRLYWQARIDGLMGRALTMIDAKKQARGRHLRAIAIWKQWVKFAARPSQRAEALVYLARNLFAIGADVHAIEMLETAIDSAPSRRETYAEALLMLVQRGRLPEALDAYHRALGREDVGEYLTTYFSMWVVTMARRAGVKPDPLALAYLSEVEGARWHHKLAKLVLGKVPFETLLRQAKDKGQRAELTYYEAERLLAEGKVDEAKIHWKSIVASDMMGFFEYDLAQRKLKLGPATIRTQPIDRLKKAQVSPK